MWAMRLPRNGIWGEHNLHRANIFTQETDMTTPAPRVAIITGSSRGIGASIAKRLAANGITVIVNYAGRAADADQVVTDITAQGGKAAAIQADLLYLPDSGRRQNAIGDAGELALAHLHAPMRTELQGEATDGRK